MRLICFRFSTGVNGFLFTNNVYSWKELIERCHPVLAEVTPLNEIGVDLRDSDVPCDVLISEMETNTLVTELSNKLAHLEAQKLTDNAKIDDLYKERDELREELDKMIGVFGQLPQENIVTI